MQQRSDSNWSLDSRISSLRPVCLPFRCFFLVQSSSQHFSRATLLRFTRKSDSRNKVIAERETVNNDLSRDRENRERWIDQHNESCSDIEARININLRQLRALWRCFFHVISDRLYGISWLSIILNLNWPSKRRIYCTRAGSDILRRIFVMSSVDVDDNSVIAHPDSYYVERHEL